MKKNKLVTEETVRVKRFGETKFLIVIAMVAILVWLITKFAISVTVVKGDSMYPTLKNKEITFVNKMVKSFSRQDIIVFNTEKEGILVKRIIGLPGETIKVDDNNNVYINGVIYEDTSAYFSDDDRYNNKPVEYILGDDEYFVLGDNRNDSLDSRSVLIGKVNSKDIIGKLMGYREK